MGIQFPRCLLPLLGVAGLLCVSGGGAESSALGLGFRNAGRLFGAGGLPLRFVPATKSPLGGQELVARGPGYSLSLSPSAAELRRPGGGTPVRMRWLGARADAQVEGAERLPGTFSYFRGGDPARWRHGLPTYARARIREVYPGIDLELYGSEGALEYGFVLAPGADPASIRLGFEGSDRLSVDSSGDLVLATPSGELRQRKPRLYQPCPLGPREVSGSYDLQPDGTLGFAVGDYDPLLPLVIDPALLSSSVWGKDLADSGRQVVLDPEGNIYVLAEVTSESQQSALGDTDLLVLKLNPAGDELITGAFLGGTSLEQAEGLAVDDAGCAYVAANSWSFDNTTTPEPEGFPLTSNAYSTSEDYAPHAVFLKLDAGMENLLYSSRFPFAELAGIALDGQRNVYLAGTTGNRNFPVTPGALQTENTCGSNYQAFVAKLDLTKSGADSLLYSTYLTGTGCGDARAIAADAEGNAYVTGVVTGPGLPVTPQAPQPEFGGSPLGDVFVAKIDPTGSRRLLTTYLGGQFDEVPYAIAADAQGAIYVTGYAFMGFPTTPGSFQPEYHPGDCQTGPGTTVCTDAFVTKYKPDGTLAYSTFLGGVYYDNGQGITADDQGNAFVVGQTMSLNFPLVDPVTSADGGDRDAFISVLSPDGSKLLFSTLLGGSGDDMARGVAWEAKTKTLLVTGYSKSRAQGSGQDPKLFPLVKPLTLEGLPGSSSDQSAYNGDIFLARIGLDSLPTGPGSGTGLGDVSGDGKVNMVDVIKLLRAIAGLEVLPAERQDAADLVGDGRINLADLLKLLRVVAGLEPMPG